MKNHKEFPKRILALLLAICMICALTSCGIAGKALKIGKALRDGKAGSGDDVTGQSGGSDDGQQDGSDTADADNSGTTDDSQNADNTGTSDGEGSENVGEATDNADAADGIGETEAIGLFSEVYLRSRSDMDWRDNRDLLIDYEYELIDLGEDTKKEYPELAKKLLIANDLIATEESNMYRSDLEGLSDMTEEEYQKASGDFRVPMKGYWNVYTRRTDEEVFSFVVQNRLLSGAEYDRVKFSCFNFAPKTGEELTLSDVVADEDAFIRLVQEHLEAEIEDTMPDLYEKGSPDVSLVKQHLDTGARGNWTIDPQGVTVWFDYFTFLPVDLSVTVLYSEDRDGTIFRERFRDHVPENWVMGLPLYRKTVFDAEDDGARDELIVYEYLDYYDDDYDTSYVTGITTKYNGKMAHFTGWDDIYDHRLSLIRSNGRTYLLQEMSEYDYSFLNSYLFNGGEIEDKGYLEGYVSTLSFDEIGEGEYMLPRHLITDPREFRVISSTDMLSTCSSERTYELKEDGTISPIEDYYTIVKDSRFTVTLKVPITEIHEVNEASMEELPAEMELKPGEKLTMEYTDGESYTDCRTKDGRLVRIRLYREPDEWMKYVRSGDKKVSIYDAFADTMFAG